MAEYSPARTPRAPCYPLSPSCNPFQCGGLGGFRAGFESEMGCFQISLRQLCPLSLMQRGIKIDMKIIGGEMAPPPWGPNSSPQPQHRCVWGYCPAQGVPGSGPLACLQPQGHKSLPFPRLSVHAKAPVPVPIPYPSPNIFLTWDGGRHRRQQLSSPVPLFPAQSHSQNTPRARCRSCTRPLPGPHGGLLAPWSHRPLGWAQART